MGTSQFQFTDPVLSELQFYINDNYDAQNEDINLKLSLSVNNNKLSGTEAVVELCVEIGEKSALAPFYITATEGAIFRWEEGIFSEEQDIHKFLSINAPALLLSYLRPIVSNITAMSKYPTYNIPFINFNDVK